MATPQQKAYLLFELLCICLNFRTVQKSETLLERNFRQCRAVSDSGHFALFNIFAPGAFIDTDYTPIPKPLTGYLVYEFILDFINGIVQKLVSLRIKSVVHDLKFEDVITIDVGKSV
jgi:hypothetical protein